MKRATLSSRERVIRAINFQEPDRVPFHLTFTVDAYHRLRHYLNLAPEVDIAVGDWTEVSPSLDLLDAMKIDIYRSGLNPPENHTAPKTMDGLQYDEWQIGRKKVEHKDGGYYFEMVKFPLENASIEDVADFPWPDPYDPGRTANLRERIERIRKETDKAIMMKFPYSIWELSWWLYGMEHWMIDIALEPKVPMAIMDRVTDIMIGFMKVGLESVGDLVDIVHLGGEDLGSQTGPLISLNMFNSLVKPRFDRLWNFTRGKLKEINPNAKLMVHSCGSVRTFIPTWIEMGLNILDPIQPRAKGMQPVALKKDFGNQLAFHGGIDLQHTLPFGTPDEVKAEVKRYIQALAPGGGYIVAAAHFVQSDIPPANLVAIRDAILEFGTYPINDQLEKS